jgi:hypothetical protein
MMIRWRLDGCFLNGVKLLMDAGPLFETGP